MELDTDLSTVFLDLVFIVWLHIFGFSSSMYLLVLTTVSVVYLCEIIPHNFI